MTNINANNKSIPDFKLIAPSIWEHAPPSASASVYTLSKGFETPSLILLCTWTGAQNRHIAKYTAEYQFLFPSTHIMVITTSAKDLCFRNSKRKQERMKPAVERISSYKYLNDQEPNRGILLHVFSEGGSNKACELAEAYYNITTTRLPASALCFDSTPGHPRYLRLCNALNKSLPPVPVLRPTAMVLGSALLGCIWILYLGIKGPENNVISRTRRRLLDPIHFDSATPRCYLYSKSDALISWEDVCEHAEESMNAGMSVTKVLFENSGHVGHAREEPKRYWDAVIATWRKASVTEKSTVILEKGMTIKHEEVFCDTDSQRTLLPAGPRGSNSTASD
ncbi:hypothetical protein BDW02DRAFT_416091 [Decorospora gaudefroyi]|uniref:Indole-diterpene biosynthesis protein-like protein PaxU n=1 Tax=Decorospora gaudefroyi TaxID=184978 RepID=A0A6A5K9L3_9PLEO|nr:hypothetical protein BDW02DRAFT_416091 [Decorospora gaudefroyi]